MVNLVWATAEVSVGGVPAFVSLEIPGEVCEYTPAAGETMRTEDSPSQQIDPGHIIRAHILLLSPSGLHLA